MDGTWRAPGRVNLIGEHTDYNDGFVLPLAIPHAVTAQVSTRDDGRVRARSRQLPGDPVEFPVETVPGEVSGWAAYVAGVVWALRAAGHEVPGADIEVDSTVPAGAGLSSSAAIECAIATALNDLATLGLDRSTLARIAQRAENDYVGMPCGMMDQMASMHGRTGHLVFLDTRSGAVEHVPFDPEAAGLALLVVDTRAAHELVGGEYAERRRDCEHAAKQLEVAALRDADLGMVESSDLTERLRRRARHVVTENARVTDVASALRLNPDPRSIAPILTASHVSLRDDFEVTIAELDVAVEAALEAGAHGARMTGGGFGGSVIALTDLPAVREVTDRVASAFRSRDFGPPHQFVVAPGAGAQRVDEHGS